MNVPCKHVKKMQQSPGDSKYQRQIKLVSKSGLMETNESYVTENR